MGMGLALVSTCVFDCLLLFSFSLRKQGHELSVISVELTCFRHLTFFEQPHYGFKFHSCGLSFLHHAVATAFSSASLLHARLSLCSLCRVQST